MIASVSSDELTEAVIGAKALLTRHMVCLLTHVLILQHFVKMFTQCISVNRQLITS